MQGVASEKGKNHSVRGSHQETEFKALQGFLDATGSRKRRFLSRFCEKVGVYGEKCLPNLLGKHSLVTSGNGLQRTFPPSREVRVGEGCGVPKRSDGRGETPFLGDQFHPLFGSVNTPSARSNPGHRRSPAGCYPRARTAAFFRRKYSALPARLAWPDRPLWP